MRRLFIILLIIGLSAGLACSVALANEVCYKCHERKNFTGKFTHGPVSQGKCGDCHNPHVAKYPGLLQGEGAELCYACHKRAKTEFAKGVVHQPVRDGKCLGCHAPHAAGHDGLLRKSLAETCFVCHQELAKPQAVSHKPFAQGQCTVCHQPHQAKNGQLLKMEADSLCLSCHQQAQSSAGHRGFPSKLSGCLSCHNPHGSSRKGLVRHHLHQPFAEKKCDSCHGPQQKNGSDACLRCHAGMKTSMMAPHNHMFAGMENGCILCHSPHAADDKKMLKTSGNKVCQPCHEDTFARTSRSLHRHPSVNSCSECHEVHGSDRLAMLRDDGNQVCSRCHLTQGKFSHPVGDKVLDQRTGKMMTCVTCHDPMGSPNRYHLVLSGKKELCTQCHRSY